MASAVLEGIKGTLECPNCLGFFKDPVTLNCGHSFCRKCLTDFVQAHPTAVSSKIFPCAVCRQDTPVPKPARPVGEWGKQLMPSFTIRRLVEQVTESTTTGKGDNCSVCTSVGETTPAVTWCRDCAMILCQRCSRTHVKTNPDHVHTDIKHKTRGQSSMNIQCADHKKDVKHHCKDCNKEICNTGCSQHHRGHKIISIEKRIQEMKTKILQKEQEVKTKVDERKSYVTNRKFAIGFFESKQSTAVSKIRYVEKNLILFIREKFQNDVDKVGKITEEAISRAKSELKTAEIDLHTFEQHFTMLREVQESEDQKEIRAAHEFCETGSLFPETPPGEPPQKHLLDIDIDYSLDLHKVHEMFSKFGDVDVSFGDLPQVTSDLELFSQPALVTLITASIEEDVTKPKLEDITVLTVNDSDVIVVADYENCSVKSFYGKSHSVCQISSRPCGVTTARGNRVIVLLSGGYSLVTLLVTPDLMIEKTIRVPLRYNSIVMLDSGLLAACADGGPGSVDILDVGEEKGKIVQTLPNPLISIPYCLDVIRDGNNSIVLSDVVNDDLICLTSEGEIAWKYIPPPGKKCKPRGVSTTRGGEVIFVDIAYRKIIMLTGSGRHNIDLLTTENSEIDRPNYIHWDDRGYLYITDKDRILVYKVQLKK